MNKILLSLVCILTNMASPILCMYKLPLVYLHTITNNTNKDLRITGFKSQKTIYLKPHSAYRNEANDLTVNIFNFFANNVGRLTIANATQEMAHINFMVDLDGLKFYHIKADLVTIQEPNAPRKSYNFKGIGAQAEFSFNLILEGENLEKSRLEYALPEMPEA
ncbi:hypothetical protein Noda2021_08540 [Candidatus Dependentiae bacterium Noda2021]|nr:hypothetical protein Noda2021_08540 [Candidatus Dependentiae bacterium Noda2021]